MAIHTTQQLFEHELRDIYFAEQKLVKALGKMSKHVKSIELRDGFKSHQKETEGHVKRLEKVFKHIDKAPRGKKCEGILGLTAEHDSMMEEDMSDEVNEMVHISSAVKAERYEISAYESLIQLAQGMGEREIVDLLQQNLREEQLTLEKLHQISGGGSTTYTGDSAQLDVGFEA